MKTKTVPAAPIAFPELLSGVLFPFVILVVLFLLCSPASAQQQNSCADCHFANQTLYRIHIEDWQASAHADHDVGCDGCHGGDASTYDTSRAHKGVMSSANPASPTHYTNLPKTCGSCHTEQYKAFQKSRHSELLANKEMRGPSCSTCHAPGGSFVLSVRGLELQCTACHGEGKRYPRTDLPQAARRVHERVTNVRRTIEQTRRVIRRVEDKDKREDLDRRLDEAEKPLHQAIELAHAFAIGPAFEEKLETAESKTDKLLLSLVNP